MAVKYEPEEVRVTALIDEVDDIKEVATPSLYYDGLVGDTILELTFLPGKYIDVSPEKVQVHVDVAQYVNRVVSVPVEYVKFPSEINLDFLPRDVDVMYEVLDANEDKVRPSDFSVQLRFEDCSYSVMLRTVQVLEDKFTVSTSSPFVRNVSLRDIQSPDTLNSNLLDFAL
jgi:YbbR domain-containing protein